MDTPATNPPEHFQVFEGYSSYAPAGVVTLETATDLVTSAILLARDQKITRLLVDITQLSGFPSPSLAERYFIVRKWAMAGKSLVEVALVMQRHLIDPERFGVQVAINLGMRTDVFDSSSQGLSWLLSGANPHPFTR